MISCFNRPILTEKNQIRRSRNRVEEMEALSEWSGQERRTGDVGVGVGLGVGLPFPSETRRWAGGGRGGDGDAADEVETRRWAGGGVRLGVE
ncbi:hypothetical protein LINPERPRIM_LOCUS11886 [Linum perenne]